MTCEEALAALKTGDPIHVQGEEMRRFIEAVAPVTCRCKCHITDFGPCDDCSAASITSGNKSCHELYLRGGS